MRKSTQQTDDRHAHNPINNQTRIKALSNTCTICDRQSSKPKILWRLSMTPPSKSWRKIESFRLTPSCASCIEGSNWSERKSTIRKQPRSWKDLFLYSMDSNRARTEDSCLTAPQAKPQSTSIRSEHTVRIKTRGDSRLLIKSMLPPMLRIAIISPARSSVRIIM